MKNEKTFYLLHPALVDAQLTKDVGTIPYLMQKYYGYKTVIATYKPTYGKYTYPSLELLDQTIEFDYIMPSFEYNPNDRTNTVYGKNFDDTSKDMKHYIENNAAKIDVLYIFGFYQYYYDAVIRYKELNPDGKVYLKLDANIGWVNKTSMNNPFIKFLKSCDLITSESLVEYLNLKWPVPIHYIANGYYPFGCKENNLTKNISFDEKENIILTVGRLGTLQKATDVLLEAFKMAKKHISDNWKLVLIGSIEDTFKPYLQKFLNKNLDLQEHIIFTGHIQDKTILNKWYRKAKIFAMPSEFEASVHVITEAKVHGCYLAVSDIESSRDAVSSYELRGKYFDEKYKLKNRIVKYGSIYGAGNISEMAERLVDACGNEALLKKVCHETQQDAIENYDWIKLCQKIDIMLNLSN